MGERDLLIQEERSSISVGRLLCEGVLLAFASLFFIVTVLVSAFSLSSDPERFGFKNSTANGTYEIQVTPAGWTEIIWIVVFVWQALWLLYAWTFACRPSSPRPVFWGVYATFSLTCITNIAWVYLWGNEKAQVALAFMVILLISLYGAVAMQLRKLYRKTAKLEGEHPCDLWLTRIIVHNGLMVYATWITMVAFLNTAVVIQYYGKFSKSATIEANASTVCLALIAFSLLFYFFLENTVFDRFLRYSYVVYPVVIWVLAGVLARNWHHKHSTRNNIFALVLMVVTILLTILRLALLVLFGFVRPIRRHQTYQFV